MLILGLMIGFWCEVMGGGRGGNVIDFCGEMVIWRGLGLVGIGGVMDELVDCCVCERWGLDYKGKGVGWDRMEGGGKRKECE